ncbi:MAG: thioredoxin domain-containing protein, partial [Thermoproteota archaeon]|nr:thioredoxin domain-containing protein [Thermoproteota archaeon]
MQLHGDDRETKARANRLFGESSPYLLQHAHNPVEWYPWGEESLQK